MKYYYFKFINFINELCSNGNIIEYLNIIRSVLEFESRDSDIYVISYPKSGTTWMQMILFQLTTDGDINTFDHIYNYSPILEQGRSNTDLKPGTRRIVKTHLDRKYWLPSFTGKKICVIRNGLDAAISYFHHSVSYDGFQGSLDEFLENFLEEKEWFIHVSGWIKERDNILFVCYEDLENNLEGSIRDIAKFCEIELKEADLPRIMNNCSFEYMKKNEAKLSFGHYEKMESKVGNFFRKGKSGDRNNLSQNHKIEFQDILKKYSRDPLLKQYQEK